MTESYVLRVKMFGTALVLSAFAVPPLKYT